MKTGKEIKINKFKDYNIVIGSTNNKQSKAIYVNISSWGQPKLEDEVNYSRVIKDINKKIKQTIFNFLEDKEYSEFAQDRTIVDLDIRESGIRFGKRSFINCEITLFLTSEIQVTSEYTKIKLDNIINNITSNILDNNKNFNFYKKKN